MYRTSNCEQWMMPETMDQPRIEFLPLRCQPQTMQEHLFRHRREYKLVHHLHLRTDEKIQIKRPASM